MDSMPNVSNESAAADRVSPLQTVWICLALAAITFAVFGQTLTHGFVNYDDDTYVYNNSVVTQGLTGNGVALALTQAHAANWHPLTWMSHMLDCQLYGLRPGGHHFTNVLLHTISVIVLFLVLRQMTGAIWRSAFVAAVFAIHPLRVESVAWVAERKDVLSGMFFVLTIAAYVYYARASSIARYVLVIFSFVLGLMSKPMLVTLPVVLLLLDYWPLRRTEPLRKIALEKVPFFVISAAACVVTIFAQHQEIQLHEHLPLTTRLANAAVSCAVYVRQMFFPARLMVFYPYPLNGHPAWKVLASVVFLVGLSAGAIGTRKRFPWLFVGWAWYLVMLLPVIGIIQVGEQAHADRYTYLPQIGLYIAITWLAAEWCASRWIAGLAMTGTVAALAAGAGKQCAYWKNNETLWTHELACAGRSYAAEFHLGNAFREQGRIAEAMDHYRNATQITPNDGEADDNLGHLLLQQGNVALAVRHFNDALKQNPRLVNAYFNLGNALREQGSLDDAIAQYQKAIQIDPRFAAAYDSYGMALYQSGKPADAITQYQQSIQINPTVAQPHFDLGVALLQMRRADDAIAQFEIALKLRPKYMMAQNYLASAFLQKGDTAQAVAHFKAALELAPSNPAILSNLAWLLATSPDDSIRNGNQAVELAERAHQITRGENPLVVSTLAAAYAETGRYQEAAQMAQRALQMAETQSNTNLAAQLKTQIELYQLNVPFHTVGQGAKPGK